MPGSIVFRPIEANLTHNTELLGKMDPYVQFILGDHKIRTQVCKKGGKHPMWDDSVTVPSSSSFGTCLVEIKDKDLLMDDRIGAFEVDLAEVQTNGSVKKWYPLFHKNKPAGELLMEAVFTADSGFGGQSLGNQGFINQNLGTQLGTGYGTVPLTTSTNYVAPMNSTYVAPTNNLTNPLMAGSLAGGIPFQTQGQIPAPGGKSLSEQFAEEALLRGVDPLHSHSNYLGMEQPLPTSTGGMAGSLPGMNLAKTTLNQKDIPVNAPSGMVSHNPIQTSNYVYNPSQQKAMPMQHGQFTPVGTGLGSDYMTNNITIATTAGSDQLASNMGTTGQHHHHDQKVFGHGNHGPEHGTMVKESLNPTTLGPKGTPNTETYDRKLTNF